MDPVYDGACIGGGLAFDSVLRGYLGENSARGLRPRHRLVVIEPRSRLGVGTAWDETEPLVSSNMRADTLLVHGGLGPDGEFRFEQATSLLRNGARWPGSPNAYPPRIEVGRRLHQLSQETAARAYGDGIVIEHAAARATRVQREPRGWRIVLDDGRSLCARFVVFALGLLPVDHYPALRGQPGYHSDPWNPGGLVQTLSVRDRVVILGAGPTAIDWVLRLDRDFAEPIRLVSRSGRLPAVRPVAGPSTGETLFGVEQLRAAAEHGRFTRSHVDFIIRGVLGEAGCKPSELNRWLSLYRAGGRLLFETTLSDCEVSQPLFDGLKRLDDLAVTIWLCADDDARDHIINVYAKLHSALSFAIPPANARAIRSRFDSGRLETLGGLQDVKYQDGVFRLRLASGRGRVIELEADRVVNASGFDGSLAACTNDLVRELLADGLLHEGRYGGAAVDYGTGQVVNAQGRPLAGLYAAGGSLLRSSAYMVNSLREASRHGNLVGQECARFLQLRDSEAGRVRQKELTA